MEFALIIGVPGSERETALRHLETGGYAVVSPDVLQGAIANDPAACRYLTQTLGSGRSCAADGSRLSRRKRAALLRTLKGTGCVCRCLLVLSSPETCLERLRERGRLSETERLDEALRRFECPYDYEGWDRIEIEYSGKAYAFPFDKAMTFSQDNPHHTLTLGEHMAAAERHCREKGCCDTVIEAARYHDIGKYYTKRFRNLKNEPTDAAHFYGHDGCGAYLYLCEAAGKGELSEAARHRALTVACLISWHMMPLNAWRFSPSAREKHRRWMGEALYGMLLQVHEADASAH